jgi:hypothetical protein
MKTSRLTLPVLSILISVLFLNFVNPGQQKSQQIQANHITSAEKKAGWQLLFDGQSFNGWRGLGRDHVPEGLWVVENGMIRKIKNSDVTRLPDGRAVENGDLMTVDTFSDFELYFEWKINKAGNSGLKYNVSEEMAKQNGSPYSALGFEYQMLDDSDPSYKNLHASQYSGSLYDLIPAKNIQLKPVGEWNQSRIIVKGNHGEHWLNGIRVVDYEFGSRELEDAFNLSKFSKIKGFIEKRQAHIVLQNHNDEAWFRNIKIRVL